MLVCQPRRGVIFIPMGQECMCTWPRGQAHANLARMGIHIRKDKRCMYMVYISYVCITTYTVIVAPDWLARLESRNLGIVIDKS